MCAAGVLTGMYQHVRASRWTTSRPLRVIVVTATVTTVALAGWIMAATPATSMVRDSYETAEQHRHECLASVDNARAAIDEAGESIAPHTYAFLNGACDATTTSSRAARALRVNALANDALISDRDRADQIAARWGTSTDPSVASAPDQG